MFAGILKYCKSVYLSGSHCQKRRYARSSDDSQFFFFFFFFLTIYIELYCVWLYTQSTLQSYEGSLFNHHQHPLGWCDGNHSTTAPVRSPHTSYRWRGESARSEWRKGNPLRKYTIKDTFRCLITIWSIGIAKWGLNEHIFVKTSNSTFFTFLFIFLSVAQNSPCAFTLILPAWVPYNVIKPRRSTKLSSTDVQKAMPQKIRSACLHDSRIGTYPIYFHIWMRPESDLAISEYMRFFPVYTVIEQIHLCHIWAKNRNWVTFNWQCKRGFREAESLRSKDGQRLFNLWKSS